MTGLRWWMLLAFLGLAANSRADVPKLLAPKKDMQICIPRPLNDQEVMALSREDRQLYVRRVHAALGPLVNLRNHITASTPAATSEKLRDLISKFSWIEAVYAEPNVAALPPLDAEESGRCDT